MLILKAVSNEQECNDKLAEVTAEVSSTTLAAATLMRHLLSLLDLVTPLSPTYTVPLSLLLNTIIYHVSQIPGKSKIMI